MAVSNGVPVSQPVPRPPSANKKRLIVLCDGTWEDSTADDKQAYPTNVTRFARALSAWTRPEGGDEIEQIVYYQKGIGTNSYLDSIVGGAVGAGVSANMRSAYAFLAHNYDAGDEIFFFGFSRGAYTARAIAGMVSEVGLLTKKGMDRFTDLYDAYHKLRLSGQVPQQSDMVDINKLKDELLLDEGAARAIQIVGVWDTVAFHDAGLAKRIGYGGETIEFTDASLSPNVKYGFHALALDERRKAFLPTLWEVPSEKPADSLTIEMKQVWFSGRHTDVGGGDTNHYLSDITLAWMIAECTQTGLLGFDDSYCLETKKAAPLSWDTALGTTDQPGTQTWYNTLIFAANKIPGAHTLVDRQPLSLRSKTNESVHASIADRRFGKCEGAAKATAYPCNLLTGIHGSDGWQLMNNLNNNLPVAEVLPIEKMYKGRIRPANE